MSESAVPQRLLSMVSYTAKLHRALFVLATTGVAISGSRIAAESSEVSSWLFVAGFGLLLVGADLLRSVEETAVELARTSSQPLTPTRVDVFRTSNPWRTVLVGLAGLATIAVAALTALG